jgi:hypothetical protein
VSGRIEGCISNLERLSTRLGEDSEHGCRVRLAAARRSLHSDRDDGVGVVVSSEEGVAGNERSPFDFDAVKRPRDERAETPSVTTDGAFHAATALASSISTQGRHSTRLGMTAVDAALGLFRDWR